jgi:long-subunit acyl-CoA synthetase (AMP-forming)
MTGTKRCRLKGLRLTNHFSECMPIASPPCTYKLEKPGSSGVPVGPEVCTFSEDGIPLRPNEVGEICIRGPPCFSGYENNPESNSQSFLPGGWFKTGDCGFLDEGNYLYITGRSKEIINRGGETISPMEIEQVRLIFFLAVPAQQHIRYLCRWSFSTHWC